MVNGPKHYRDLHDNTFIMLIDHCEDNWVGTNLSESYGKFQDCLLTHWLPISSILFLIGTISMQSIQMQLSKKKIFFLKFFHHFLNLDKHFEKKNMTLIAYAFPKLQTAKNVVRQMSKGSRFGRPFIKRHGKWSKTLLKSARQQLYRVYWSLSRQFSRKKSFLVIWRILGLSIETLTAEDKYSLLNRHNFNAIN